MNVLAGALHIHLDKLCVSLAAWCRTWNNLNQHTMAFLGFVYSHCMEAGDRLGLHMFRDKFSGFLRFISMLKARGRGGDYMAKTCHSAVRHLHHLKATSPRPYTAAQLQQFNEQLEILGTLKWQLRKICRHIPFNYQALLEGSGWNDAPELIAYIEEEKQTAINIMKVSWGKLAVSAGCAGFAGVCRARAAQLPLPLYLIVQAQGMFVCMSAGSLCIVHCF